MKRITVLLADDSKIMRRACREILELDADLEVVGEAKNGVEAVAMTQNLRPKIVLMDISMPLLNGFQATRQILETVPAAKVLIYSIHNDHEYVEAAINSGAMGYLLKQASPGSVGLAIREVHKGNKSFGPLIAAVLRNGIQTDRSIDD